MKALLLETCPRTQSGFVVLFLYDAGEKLEAAMTQYLCAHITKSKSSLFFGKIVADVASWQRFTLEVTPLAVLLLTSFRFK